MYVQFSTSPSSQAGIEVADLAPAHMHSPPPNFLQFLCPIHCPLAVWFIQQTFMRCQHCDRLCGTITFMVDAGSWECFPALAFASNYPGVAKQIQSTDLVMVARGPSRTWERSPDPEA